MFFKHKELFSLIIPFVFGMYENMAQPIRDITYRELNSETPPKELKISEHVQPNREINLKKNLKSKTFDDDHGVIYKLRKKAVASKKPKKSTRRKRVSTFRPSSFIVRKRGVSVRIRVSLKCQNKRILQRKLMKAWSKHEKKFRGSRSKRVVMKGLMVSAASHYPYSPKLWLFVIIWFCFCWDRQHGGTEKEEPQSSGKLHGAKKRKRNILRPHYVKVYLSSVYLGNHLGVAPRHEHTAISKKAFDLDHRFRELVAAQLKNQICHILSGLEINRVNRQAKDQRIHGLVQRLNSYGILFPSFFLAYRTSHL